MTMEALALPDPTLAHIQGEARFEHVLRALQSVRLRFAGQSEFEIHDALSRVLADAGIPHRREYTFGPRCRADLWTQGIAVEVKKQKPPRSDLLAQIERYTAQPALTGLIVVLEKSVHLPKELNGKRVGLLSLNTLWGIAL